MPTYEYGCSECHTEWEEVQRITAPPTEVCPKCGKTSAHRLISPGTNFILKGGGWYSDLYASPGAKKKSEDASASSSPGDAAKKDTATPSAPKADAPAPAPASTAEKAA